jgi:hypothetical protein
VIGRAAALALAASSVITLAGCGGGEEPAPEPRPVESIHPVPDLPAGWRPYANAAGGYAFGLPRGWTTREHGPVTDVRSFDRLAAITINADRTNEALAIAPDAFAPRALASAPGFRRPLEPGDPRSVDHRYEAARVSAGGASAETGIDLDASMTVLRRDELAVLTALIVSRASPKAAPSRRLAERVVETLRTRPVGTAAP